MLGLLEKPINQTVLLQQGCATFVKGHPSESKPVPLRDDQSAK
jgi:hypothetical protein